MAKVQDLVVWTLKDYFRYVLLTLEYYAVFVNCAVVHIYVWPFHGFMTDY